MSSPRVTLAIAAYNGERYLAEAVESCLAQDYADFELLIVDDASSDSTPAVIARYTDDPRVRVVRHPENRGIAAAVIRLSTDDALWSRLSEGGRELVCERLGTVACEAALERIVAGLVTRRAA